MTCSRKAVSLSVLVLFISVYFSCLRQQRHPGEDEPVPVEDLISGHGYPVESHEVVTEDGYILRLHRIPHGKDPPVGAQWPARRRPVLLSHGLVTSSAMWVLLPSALGFMLADAGFDVWVLNHRGNSFSRRHIQLDPDKDMQFWNFSIHEYGYYDLAAGVDYVLAATGRARLLFAGLSMGATNLLVLGATRPQYMQKVQAVALLAPVAFFSGTTSPVVRFISTSGISFLTWLHNTLGVHEVFPYRLAGPWSKHALVKDVVMRIINNACGEDDENLLKDIMSIIMQHFPAGTSYNVLLHFAQIYEKGFNDFDHGAEVNQRVYGRPEAPAYNLSVVNAPVHVFYAPNDWLVVPQTFLPMVIQKSTTEAARILENHPSLSDKQSVTDQITKHEVEDKINICIQRNLNMTKVISATPETPLSLMQAFTMDLAQMQERLLLLWARGHLWMSGQRGGLLRTLPVIVGTPNHLLWVEGRPRAVDREETATTATAFTTTVPTIASETGKRRPANPDASRALRNKPELATAAGTPLRSNLWEAVQQRSPAWQATIAARLAALQKTVVQKLSK